MQNVYDSNNFYIFEYKFLFWYYTKICKELIQLFNDEKKCIKCFQGEHELRGHDWQTGKYCSILLSENIRYNEKVQVDRLKRKKLPLTPKFQEETTIDLTCDEIS